MPRLEYDAAVGLTAPETAELRDAVAANWQEAFKKDGHPLLDVDPSTPAGQLIDSEASFLAETNAEILRISNQLNPRVAEGPWQDAIGYIYFLDRKIAQPTTVTVTCGGLPGTVIPAGAQVMASLEIVSLPEEQKNIRYECIQDTEIPESGEAEVLFRCTKAGAVECTKETLTQIVTTVPGWTSAINKAAGVIGWDRESQWDFEARRFASVAKNAHGTVESIQGSIWNIKDVIDCRVLENPTGTTVVKHGVCIAPHSVAISVYGGEDVDIAEAIYLKKDAGCGTCLDEKSGWLPLPSGIDPMQAPYSYKGEKASVAALPVSAEALDVWKIAGSVPAAYYYYADYSEFTRIMFPDEEFGGVVYPYGIIRPEERAVQIRVVYHKTVSTPPSMKTDIRNAVYSDFYGQNKESGNVRVGCCQTIYASRFSVAAVKTAGVENLVSIEIRFWHPVGEPQDPWASSIVIDGKTEPTLSRDEGQNPGIVVEEVD